MNKKGFTLIELLAVIVILAIIAVIAVPIVLNIIDESKKNAGLRSAEMYVKAAEMSIAQSTLKDINIPADEYQIKDGDICLNDGCTETLKVEVNGEVPESGTITITNGNISGLNITLNEKEIYKNSKGELVYVKFLDEVCELKSGTPKTAGAKYSCKVDPNKDAYTFYVLTTPTSTDESINLIMDRNICSDGSFATSTNTCLVAWTSKDDYGTLYPYDENVCWDESGCALNDKGPLTAMKFLQEATKDWTNTNEMTIDKFDNDSGTKFDMQAYTTNARLPYYSEVSDSNGSNEYLYENLDSANNGEDWYGASGKQPTNNITNIYGYWTLSSYADNSNNAWAVNYHGNVGIDGVDYDNICGVRAVINLKI